MYNSIWSVILFLSFVCFSGNWSLHQIYWPFLLPDCNDALKLHNFDSKNRKVPQKKRLIDCQSTNSAGWVNLRKLMVRFKNLTAE